MATYEYKCNSCGKTTEITKKMTEPAPKECPHCGGELHQVYSHANFALTGVGWARDNYGGNGR